MPYSVLKKVYDRGMAAGEVDTDQARKYNGPLLV